MTDFFVYPFLQKALWVGFLLAVIVPCIGAVVVLRRLSMLGDALSHSSLAGVAGGLIMGANPIVGAMTACVLAALGIEGVRRKLPRYAELSVAVVTSAGIGLAAVLSDKIRGAAGFESFLFGSIAAVSDFEALLVTGVAAFVLISFRLLYRPLMAVAFDETAAKLSGIRVGRVNLFFTVLTAVTVSVAARSVGTLIVSSLMVLPTACAMQVAKSFKGTVAASVGFGVLFTLTGLFVSYGLELRPGGTVVLIGTAALILILTVKSVAARAAGRKAPAKPETEV